MQARVAEEGEVLVVQLIGHVDVETAERFRHTFLRRFPARKVVLNFAQLSFVGSSGILPFLETMQEFARTNEGRIKFCGVSVDFQRVLHSTPLAAIEIFHAEKDAINAFSPVQSVPLTGSPVSGPSEGN